MNPVEYLALRYLHKKQHYNKLFYTLTPELLLATVKAFQNAHPLLMQDGAYYEFGIFKGYNLWVAHMLQPFIHAYGFDSFEGMPRTKGAHPHHAAGMYSASVDEVWHHLLTHKANPARVHLFKGWFCDEYFNSLGKDFLAAAVATVDCDLYASAVPVLRFLVPHLRPGTVLLFDDWHMESPSEADAWREAKAKYHIKDETLFEFGLYGHAVRIKEIANGKT